MARLETGNMICSSDVRMMAAHGRDTYSLLFPAKKQ